MKLLQQFFYKRRRFYDDDFDWENYTADSYARRLKNSVESEYRVAFGAGELQFDAQTGQVLAKEGDIHPNQRLIFEAVGQLAPASVHEVGCGGGDHIANIATLFPQVEVTGGDRGLSQLKLAIERHPALKGKIAQQDITMPFSHRWPQSELVYTQAVIMHIHTAVSHFVALTNLVRKAQKYVLLVENTQCHNFVSDIQTLYENGHLDWDKLYIYRFDGSTGARAILLSKVQLSLPVLRSDSEIREGEEPSMRRLRRSDENSARAIAGFSRV